MIRYDIPQGTVISSVLLLSYLAGAATFAKSFSDNFILGITDNAVPNALAIKIVLFLSLCYIGVLHWHLHRLHQEFKVNRAAIQWIFQYLADSEVATKKAFGIE